MTTDPVTLEAVAQAVPVAADAATLQVQQVNAAWVQAWAAVGQALGVIGALVASVFLARKAAEREIAAQKAADARAEAAEAAATTRSQQAEAAATTRAQQAEAAADARALAAEKRAKDAEDQAIARAKAAEKRMLEREEASLEAARVQAHAELTAAHNNPIDLVVRLLERALEEAEARLQQHESPQQDAGGVYNYALLTTEGRKLFEAISESPDHSNVDVSLMIRSLRATLERASYGGYAARSEIIEKSREYIAALRASKDELVQARI